jgi:hypothetical protein
MTSRFACVSPRTRSTTAAMHSWSLGIGSGRPLPRCLYRKLKRTTSMPCARMAAAAAVVARSDMLPPAPCAHTNTVPDWPDVAGS